MNVFSPAYHTLDSVEIYEEKKKILFSFQYWINQTDIDYVKIC